MEEKRISLRFRMNNEIDRRAWELLEEMAVKENTSKNSIAIELLHLGANAICNESNDVLAEQIADMVVQRLQGKLTPSIAVCTAGEAKESTYPVTHEKVDSEPQANELELISEEALDFMEAFV